MPLLGIHLLNRPPARLFAAALYNVQADPPYTIDRRDVS